MIHLINMPFASVLQPSLALSQIKAQLVDAGLRCRVFNLNIDLATQVGLKSYFNLVGSLRHVAETVFARQAWGLDFGPRDAELRAMYRRLDLAPAQIGHLEQSLRKLKDDLVPRYLDACVQRLLLEGPISVAAFSCTFFQTVPSLALARKLKQRDPATRIAFGGACCHGEMGDELIRKVPFIDCLSTGEADDIVVDLFRTLSSGGVPAGLQGILSRDANGDVIPGPPHHPVSPTTLEAVPDPEYSDFFEDLRLLPDETFKQMRVFLPFESSRGCWWGEKHHCKFCGLNNEGMHFRSKSPERTLRTLRNFRERYPVRRFHAADNILPTPFYQTLLPRIAADPELQDVEFFYEIKANVRAPWVAALAAAGVRYVQPGIEALSSNLLRLMDKGVTQIQNIHLLKLCRQHGVFPLWNLLVGIPGERAADYQDSANVASLIPHLCPPVGGVRRIEMHRFSPYYFDRQQWASESPPDPWYRALYPEGEIDITRVAYFFDAKWNNTLSEAAYQGLKSVVHHWTQQWCASGVPPSLSLLTCPNGTSEIHDMRRGCEGIWCLNSAESTVYEAISQPVSMSRVSERINLRPRKVESMLEAFVTGGIAHRSDGQYIGLALPPDIPSVSEEDIRRVFRSARFRSSPEPKGEAVLG